MMKGLFSYIIIGLFCLVSVAQAQPGPGREDRIQALYVAYMTKELKITETEAQKFWPVHAEYEEEMKGLRREMPELEKQQAILNVKKKYEDRFSRILGNERTDAFYKKDTEFRRQMVERLRKLREQRMQQGGGMRPRMQNPPPGGL